MKYLLPALMQFVLITSVSAQTTKVIYTCSMHPQVKTDKTGDFSKCGMTLIKKTIKVGVPKPTSPKVQEKPKSKPTEPVQKREHKDMEMNKPVQQHPKLEQQQTKVVYTCVMHPEVQKDKPGNCPNCGMSLTKKTVKVNTSKPASEKERQKQMDMEEHKDHEGESKADDVVPDEFIGSKVNMQPGKTVVYHLYVTDTTVNFTGKNKHGYAINGSIPAPTLVFTEGDTAEIYLHNNLKKEETSLHWHGVILPNRFDGVPYLTTKRIGPGDIYLYKFRVVQNGTYWYHSHTKLQEQAGMYGALVFNKREGQDMNVSPSSTDANMQHHTGHDMKNTDSTVQQNHEEHNKPMKHSMPLPPAPSKGKGDYNVEYTMVLSEWTDEKPEQVQRRLRSANDWYAIKKGSVQSYGEAINAGHLRTKLINEWKRMKAMDVSDVYYDRFLINGKPEINAPQFKAGDKVKLRIVNAGASSYFWLNYAGGKITIVGSDGNDVEPIEVDRFIIGVAEIYDVAVTIPANGSFEFRATPEDRTKATSLWLGNGMKMPARKFSRLKYF